MIVQQIDSDNLTVAPLNGAMREHASELETPSSDTWDGQTPEITLADLDRSDPYTIKLSEEAQLAFWNALNEPVVLTEAQTKLGRLMRCES